MSLLACLMVLFLQDDGQIKALLEGSESESRNARQELKDRGPQVLPALLMARPQARSKGKWDALHDLIHEIKWPPAEDPERNEILDRLARWPVTIALQDASTATLVGLLGGLSGINMCFGVPEEAVKARRDFRKEDTPLRRVLDEVLAADGLDYDVRYGVVFIGAPEQLWPAPPKPEPIPPLTEAQSKRARALVDRLGAEAIEEREEASLELVRMGRGVIGALEEGERSGQPERAARCREIRLRLQPRPATLPRVNHWRGQDLKGADLAVARKLYTARLNLNVHTARLEEVLDRIMIATGVIITAPDVNLEQTVDIHVREVRCANVVELLTLPRGLDARIEKGAVVLFPRK